MALKRSLRGQLLLLVSVGFVLLCTKDLQAEAQSELTTPSLDMTTMTTEAPTSPPVSSPYGKFISFNSICHSDIALKVI
jgi:hypothetical protein